MARLYDQEKWATELGDVVTALEAWVADEPFDLKHRRWFADGRSGSPVALAVRVREDGDTDQVVVKFFSEGGTASIQNMHRARLEAGDFSRHLAAIEEQTIRLGSWRAVFLDVAYGDLDGIKSLADRFDDRDFPKRCATIVRSVVSGWNRNKVPARAQGTVGEVLTGMIKRRRSEAEKWARDHNVEVKGTTHLGAADWPRELPNPFRLLYDDVSREIIEDLVVGKAHGDLSGRNVIIPAVREPRHDEYILIDYDRYSDSALLTRDPMHLLVALTIDRFDQFLPEIRWDVARVLVDPDYRDVSTSIEYIRKLSVAIHKASKRLATSRGMGDVWTQQCLLSLVGAGLVHLGRELRCRDPEEAKQWCLQLAACATEAYLQKRPEQRRATTATRSPVTAERGDLVDRKDDVRNLSTRLTGGPWGVVLVTGDRGIGKTKLVDAVLADLPGKTAQGIRPRIHCHDLRAADRLDVTRLIDYVQGDDDPTAPRKPGRSSLVRLESTLRTLGDSPVVVAVDSAEELLDPTTGKLVDSDLDEALELIAGEQGHRVAVLLVTQHNPVSIDGTWPTAEHPIHVRSLPRDEFLGHLANLDRLRRTDPRTLAEDKQSVLFSKLQGNPRLAELACAVVAVVESGLDLAALTGLLSQQNIKDVQTFLTGLLVQHASELQLRVLEAVAALGTPVPESAIAGLLEDEFPGCHSPGMVNQALKTLAGSQVVYRLGDDQYVIPPEDGHLIMHQIEDNKERSDRYMFAAEQLRRLRNDDPRQVAGLRLHLAELAALINAEQPKAAYRSIERIDKLLERRSCRHLLLEQRKKLKGRLTPLQELANENGLGIIYTALERFPEASDALGEALKLADQRQDSENKLLVHGNLANLYWAQHEIGLALSQYEHARDEAARLHKPDARMGMLEGIADCRRRNGDYEQAIRYAREALATRDLDDYPDTEQAQYVATWRGVVITLKLARWFGELGRPDQAERHLDSAEESIGKADWLRASLLDARADFFFDRGELEPAEQKAMEAEEVALQDQDPITLMQARTTLGLVYLKRGTTREAHNAIGGAWRYRQNRRSLIVLALHALAVRQKGDPRANELFRRLHEEASSRITRNQLDFAALQYDAFAICGQHLDGRSDLCDAVKALQDARRISPPTPALDNRLEVMFTRLDQCGSRPGRLGDVIVELKQAD
jgi:tetratricopeptide (TPR) repeat protein